MARLLLLPAALVLAAAPALADEIVLKNGRTLEGQATEAGETVVFEKSGIRMEIRRDEVREIRRTPSAKEQYAEKAAAVEKQEAVKGYLEQCRAAAAEDRHRLGLWCASKGLKDEARAEQERAVKIDPDHAGARRALGFVKTGDGWRPEDEVMREKGLVRAQGRWVTAEEAAKLESGESLSLKEKERREARDREKRLKASLNTALRRVAAAEPQVRLQGERDLVAVAREMGDPDLEARAPEVRGYYDRVYEEIHSARALLQVRAQVVTLKRPIQQFQTSLGAFTSPVTLQLPELSVISVNTTAVVPLQVDEEE